MSKPSDASGILMRWSGKMAVCLGVGGVLWACIHHQHQRPTPTSHLTQAQVYQRATTLAGVFGSTFEVLDAPQLLKHSAWTIACKSDDLSLYMTFDDATGRLWSLGVKEPLKPRTPMVAPLDTAAEARQVALHRLHDLQIVPQGSRLTLVQPPVLSGFGWMWEMIWFVTLPDGSPPYQIHLVLDRRTGFPITVMDLKQARQYVTASAR